MVWNRAASGCNRTYESHASFHDTDNVFAVECDVLFRDMENSKYTETADVIDCYGGCMVGGELHAGVFIGHENYEKALSF
jgi:hypothetical protein